MKKILVLIIITFTCCKLLAAPVADSLKQHTVFLTPVDSLKQLLQFADSNDSLKGPLYTQIAEQYLRYDTVNNHKTKLAWQNESINYTLKALHYYSRYDDTVGLRTCFDDLTKVYHAQKKYSQAKWFILQSNTLSRAKHDDLNIIVSLLELALIKTDIKDYTLAMRDLNEALSLSSKDHYPKLQSATMQNYAILYSHMKDYTKESIALKRHNAIDDSIRRDEEAKMLAKITTSDSVQQVKKKLYTVNSRRFYKNSSLKRTVSL